MAEEGETEVQVGVAADAAAPVQNGGGDEKEGIANGGSDAGAAGGDGEKPAAPVAPPPPPSKRLPAPSEKELDEKLQVQKDVVKRAQEKLAALKENNDKVRSAKSAGRGELQETVKLKNELMQTMRGRFDAKKKITDEIKQLRALDTESGSSSSRDMPRQLKGLKTVADVDRRIKELEYRHSTESLDLREERGILSEVNYLRHDGMDYMAKYEETKAAADASRDERKKRREELEALRKAEEVEITKLQKKLDEQKKIYDEKVEAQQSSYSKLSATTADVNMNDERKTINEAYDEIRRLRVEFDKAFKEHKANEAAWMQWERYKRNLRKEKAKLEREEKRREREKEKEDIPPPDPYEEEKGMCSALLTYLESVDPTTAEPKVAEPAPTEPPKAVGRDISASGTTIGKKAEQSNDDKYAAFGKGKKGKKNKVVKPAPETESKDKKLLNLSIDRFQAFHKLEIKPPTFPSEVPAAIKAVKEKQAYFASDPPPPKSEGQPKTEKQTKKKKAPVAAPEDSLVDDDQLPDGIPKPADSRANVSDPSKPSFSDIIRGKGAPLPTSTAEPTPAEADASGPSDEPEKEQAENEDTDAPAESAAPTTTHGDEMRLIGTDLEEALSSNAISNEAA